MTWRLWGFLISSGTRAQPANSYHPTNADNKLALLLSKTELLTKSFSYNGARVWNSLPNEKLCLCFTSLFQPKGQMADNNLFLGVIVNARIVLIMIVSTFTARKPNINIGPEYARIRIGARRVYLNVLKYYITADSKYTCSILLESGLFFRINSN